MAIRRKLKIVAWTGALGVSAAVAGYFILPDSG